MHEARVLFIRIARAPFFRSLRDLAGLLSASTSKPEEEEGLIC